MWKAVVTNDGKSLLASWLGGTTLNITGAYGGTGTVSEAALLAQTALVNQKQTLSILSSEAVAEGRLFRIQITAPAAGYTLEQISLKGNIGTGPVKLIALFQENDGGIPIPAVANMPDFVFTFYGTVQMSNEGTISVTIDTSAVVSNSALAAAVTAHDSDSGAHSTLFGAKLNASLKGAANGVAELDGSGKVPAAQLPASTKDKTAVIGMLKGNGTDVLVAARGADYSLAFAGTGTIAASASWSGPNGQGYYTYAVTATGVLATDNVDITRVLNMADSAAAALIQAAWNNINDVVISANTLTFYAKTRPSVAIQIAWKVVR